MLIGHYIAIIAGVSFLCSIIYFLKPYSGSSPDLYIKGMSFGLFGGAMSFLVYYLKYKRGQFLVNHFAVEDQPRKYKSNFHGMAWLVLASLIIGPMLSFLTSFSTSFGDVDNKDIFDIFIIYALCLTFAAVKYFLFIEYGWGLHKKFLNRNIIFLALIVLALYLPYPLFLSETFFYALK